MSQTTPVFATPSPRVRAVPVDRPWSWLAAGWADLRRAPRVSFAYGAVLAGASILFVLALVLAGQAFLVLPLAAGFFLVAPVLAVGLYETSRCLAAGEPATLAAALGAVRANPAQIALMGLVLMLINLAWVRIATLLFALFFAEATPGWDRMVDALLFSPESLPFLAVGTLIGAALAATTFAIGVVAIPMLLDRDTDVFTAIATSVAVVRRNPRPMALWAGLIVVFTAFGLAALLVGLALAMPLIGHASWHAYRDLVE